MIGLYLVALLWSFSLGSAFNPQWPKQFTSFWTTYFIPDADNPRVPYSNLPNGTGVKQYYGNTFYDYTQPTKRMFQMFPSMAFSGFGCPYDETRICGVLNIDQVAYAWLLDDPSTCCIEARVWVLPPNFPTRGTRLPDQDFMGQRCAWWEVIIPDNVHVGTGFSYEKNTTAGTSWGIAHYGHHPSLPFYRLMVYHHWDTSQPDQSVFEIPPPCLNATDCKPAVIPRSLQESLNRIKRS
eukprot:TRINITY_DN2758_c0_g1_i3.p1 TRINITY_DN2758_c0_g1~~TRINITY_DN2758_c0_g1_i3.p1  ORF type:complete len:238 (-),score=16.11 TRINITY_DN2758_c0_g1_i3:80-793(-)